MLNFIYTGESMLYARQSAVALRFLADYFTIDALHAAVDAKIKEALSNGWLATLWAPLYLREGISYKDRKIVGMAKDLCAENFNQLTEEQINSFSPVEFELILTSKKFRSQGRSTRELSKKIAAYLLQRQDLIDDHALASLTAAHIIPDICPTVALRFLNLIARYRSSLVKSADEIETLRERCLRACEHWEEALGTTSFVAAMRNEDERDSMRERDEFACLPDSLKVEVLQAAMKHSFNVLQELRKFRRLPAPKQIVADFPKLQGYGERRNLVLPDIVGFPGLTEEEGAVRFSGGKLCPVYVYEPNA